MKKKSELNVTAFRALMEGTGQAIFTHDPISGNMIWDDPESAFALLGVAQEPSVGGYYLFDKLLRADVTHRRGELILQAYEKKKPFKLQYQLGENVEQSNWFEETVAWVTTDDNAGRLMGVIRSVTDQKAREQQLNFIASHDELTGVLNRRKIKDVLGKELVCHEEKNQTLSYILIGIDSIPLMNINFGYETTDGVILEVAERLRTVISDADYLGRVSGTKFGIILGGATTKHTREICNKLSACIRASIFETSGSAVSVSICMGVVHVDTYDATQETVFARAEAALDEARYVGDGACVVFTEKTSNADRRKSNSEVTDFILSALNQRRVCLAYQPITKNPGETPTKFECLVRIENESGEFVPPMKFIPVAERLGLIHLLDRRVLELAVETLKMAPGIELNVNVSWATVKDPVWAEGYISFLKACREVCSRITIELTETQAVDMAEMSAEFVTAIKAVGCKFAIDDFGAGYTSFKSLQCLDIDILKIDGSFINKISSCPQNQIFVRTLLDLARNFKMQTVAEWISNEEDAALVKELGVNYLQGYLLGKPEVNPKWLAEFKPCIVPKRMSSH